MCTSLAAMVSPNVRKPPSMQALHLIHRRKPCSFKRPPQGGCTLFCLFWTDRFNMSPAWSLERGTSGKSSEVSVLERLVWPALKREQIPDQRQSNLQRHLTAVMLYLADILLTWKGVFIAFKPSSFIYCFFSALLAGGAWGEDRLFWLNSN